MLIVVDCVELPHAFQLDELSSDPDLYCWESCNNRLGDFAGKLSDLLFTTIVNNIWNGKGVSEYLTSPSA